MRVEGRSEVYEEFLTGRELEYQKAARRQYPVSLQCGSTTCSRPDTGRSNTTAPLLTPHTEKLPKPPDAIDAPDASPCPAKVSAGRQVATSRRMRRMVAKVFLA